MVINHSSILQMLVNRDVSINAQRSKNAEKMDSGSIMNRASEDCSGLAIYKDIHMRIAGLDVAKRNTQDGISIMQTIDGGLQDTEKQIGRIKQLAVQSLNGNLTDTDRKQIQVEIDQIKKGIDSTAKDTQFNGINILGQDASLKIKVLDNPDVNFNLNLYDCSTSALGISDLDLTSTGNANAALSKADQAFDKISHYLVKNGSGQNSLQQISETLTNMSYNFNATESNINDTEMASGQMEQTRLSMLQDATSAIFSQVTSINKNSLSVLGA
ncbi:flagellin [Clostridium felsineum]|uniref:flagellin n=1 Tax=Clostridium felsineum TaxID=36839 RepID=UPI00098CA7B7|nr:flagellin [Clostridium felsineum]MCR3760261.1 flagellin [Clostridium felsineum]URZ00504.1 Flagellar filament 30.7 kDa core protein [Clostridium felsineum]